MPDGDLWTGRVAPTRLIMESASKLPIDLEKEDEWASGKREMPGDPRAGSCGRPGHPGRAADLLLSGFDVVGSEEVATARVVALLHGERPLYASRAFLGRLSGCATGCVCE